MKSSSLVISSALHISLVVLTALSLPFLSKKPIDLPPIVSVELIQIAEETNIPFAPKAKKIIEKVKEKEKKLVSEQAPPKKVKKTKTKTVVSEKKNKIIEKQAHNNGYYFLSVSKVRELSKQVQGTAKVHFPQRWPNTGC